MAVFVIFTERSFIPHRFTSKQEARDWAATAKLDEQLGGWEVVAMTEREAEGYHLSEPGDRVGA